MCGLAGILHLDFEHPADPQLLRNMITQLLHRGPDGTGFHLDGPRGWPTPA
jgi:asparagine synthase (glutamine-hydrolysing)